MSKIRVETKNGPEILSSEKAIALIVSGEASLSPEQDDPPWDLVGRLKSDLGRIDRFGPRLHESEAVADAFDALFDGGRLKPSVLLEVERQNSVGIRNRILDCLTGLNGSKLMSQLGATLAYHQKMQPAQLRMSPRSLRKSRGLDVSAIELETFSPLIKEWKEFKRALAEFSNQVLDAGISGVRDGRVFVVDIRKPRYSHSKITNRSSLGSAKVAVWFSRQLMPPPSFQCEKRDVVDEIAGWMIEVAQHFRPERQVTAKQLKAIAHSIWGVKPYWCAEAADVASRKSVLPTTNFSKKLKVSDNEIKDLNITRKFLRS